MSGDDGHETFSAEELGELVERLRPQVRELLARYCIPEERAGDLVHDAMLGLAHRWHAVPDRDRWFLEALEHACAEEGADSTTETH